MTLLDAEWANANARRLQWQRVAERSPDPATRDEARTWVAHWTARLIEIEAAIAAQEAVQ